MQYFSRFSQVLALVSGPLSGLILYVFFDLAPGKPQVTAMAAITVWVAVWWITEALPLAVSSLVPIALFPLMGIESTAKTAGFYINDIIFLYIGGFMFAFAIEKWGLHTRIAMAILRGIGQKERHLLLGFMLAACLISMWISNVATTMVLMAPALSILKQFETRYGEAQTRRFASALLMGIAFAASIGGVATPVGTAPNMILLGVYEESFPNETPITFFKWMQFGLPLSLIFLAACYFYLRYYYCRKDADQQLDSFADFNLTQKGGWTFEQITIAILFGILALLWIFRENIELGSTTIYGWTSLFPHPKMFSDATTAIVMAILLFIIPSKAKKGEKLLSWKECEKLPIDVILLFGGGFALASGFEKTGLSVWMGQNMAGLQGLPPVIVVLAICVTMTILTEIASNTAAAQLVLPILVAIAPAVGVHPLFLMLPATLSASFGFMLPVATPPNTIVFGYGKIKMREMMGAGFFLDLMGIFLTTLIMMTIGRFVFGV